MTERLYYHDSFLREFEATVVSCKPSADRYEIILDRTAFYPTSGGQPHDTGRLGDAEVIDVGARDDGELLHFTSRPVPVGPIRGVLDWDRRFDHMQQHTGQHLLSAAFVERFKFPTVSFHLGRDISTIDLVAPSVVPRHLLEAERRSNEIIFEDRPISIRFALAAELAAQGVRKAVDREGPLRVVEIDRFDRQPCGGTHLARTGQAGLLLLRKCEKVKGNWRVEFVVGFRALSAARADLQTLTRAASQIGCGMTELPEMVGKILDERRSGQRSHQKLLERLASLEADQFLASAPAPPASGGSPSLFTRIFEDADAHFLRLLATRLTEKPGICVLFATRSGGHVVFAQSQGLESDMNALLREALSLAGGKGGGSKNFAQGSVPDPSLLDQVLRAVTSRLR